MNCTKVCAFKPGLAHDSGVVSDSFVMAHVDLLVSAVLHVTADVQYC